ncbi:MAG: DUF2336 domain-containing protein [Alphaproteobacteria bacterium]|nr:DUF2336 domain-containing protein [Alphaproteobacteria bacterium]MBU0803171.1 DUF2336 domain-containing protein [Alphaproteobacteria bacterium]MBU0873859.1 DUF2336 domain-containing protein [Alphaproteobacteria bacterium]MBU1400641.1 DUF2336 domain-containing protein [Alphaproteobacteria bacterium]MBU1590514.1 DUF2336 domain-containing protein [Alphaproteobacteria bacterium]
MSSSDFRQITIKGEAGKADRLFRAATSAFCSLTRPSRRDIVQIEDLALPLFNLVSVEARRYMAAALSDCQSPPPALVRRLCDETVDVAAPLLIRSKALTDTDLITLISRHGAGHARAIARRPDLHPAIASLAALLTRQPALHRREPEALQPSPTPAPAGETGTTPAPVAQGEAADNARRRLRSMMRPDPAYGSRIAVPASSRTPYERLRDTALSGSPVLFQTALADTLGLDFAQAGSVLLPTSHARLLTALRALDLDVEQAFLIAAATYPSHFPQAEKVRLFAATYRDLRHEAALERVAAWRQEVVDPLPAGAASVPAKDRGVILSAAK